MKVYAFDVDHTIDIGLTTNGPVTLTMIRDLREEGNIVGLCGNWATVTLNLTSWYRIFSFIGPLSMTKAEFLQHFAKYVPASEYVMVGNEGTTAGHSQDSEAARLAGWRFICEEDFAKGVR